MTIELCRFCWQDVFCNLKQALLLIFGLLIVSLLVCSFVYGNIAGFRVWKMISRCEIDLTSVFANDQNFVSRIFRYDCVRRPLIKGAVCCLMALVISAITMLYCVIFLAK